MFDRRKSRRTRENPPSPSIEANAGTDAGPSKSGEAEEIGSAAPHASGYPRDAREIIVDVECRLEQLGAALQVLSDGLHEDTCGNYGPVPKPLLGHLCQQWLLLEVIRRDLAATDARAVEADRILTSAQSA